jgi:hypothetical protein
MVKSIEKVFTFFVVLILIIVLLNLLGNFIANSMPGAWDKLGAILNQAWNGVQGITQTGPRHPVG